MRFFTLFLLLAASAFAAPAATSGPPLFRFDSGSSRPDPQHMPGLLDSTLRWLAEARATRIRLTAATDRLGSAPANPRLARKRALAVKRALVARGIPSAAIVFRLLGEQGGLVETRDGVAERQNRFVMVEIEAMEGPEKP